MCYVVFFCFCRLHAQTTVSCVLTTSKIRGFVHTHSCTHRHTHKYHMRLHRHMRTHTHTDTYTHACTHTQTHALTQTHVHTYTHTDIYTNACTHTHITRTHTDTHTRAHTHTRESTQVSFTQEYVLQLTNQLQMMPQFQALYDELVKEFRVLGEKW